MTNKVTFYGTNQKKMKQGHTVHLLVTRYWVRDDYTEFMEASNILLGSRVKKVSPYPRHGDNMYRVVDLNNKGYPHTLWAEVPGEPQINPHEVHYEIFASSRKFMRRLKGLEASGVVKRNSDWLYEAIANLPNLRLNRRF